jgi:hypothetical protein
VLQRDGRHSPLPIVLRRSPIVTRCTCQARLEPLSLLETDALGCSFVLAGGRIVDCGTHEELTAKQGGFYSRMASKQSLA